MGVFGCILLALCVFCLSLMSLGVFCVYVDVCGCIFVWSLCVFVDLIGFKPRGLLFVKTVELKCLFLMLDNFNFDVKFPRI